MVILSTALERFAVQEFRSLEEPLKNTYQTEQHNLYILTIKQKLEKQKEAQVYTRASLNVSQSLPSIPHSKSVTRLLLKLRNTRTFTSLIKYFSVLFDFYCYLAY